MMKLNKWLFGMVISSAAFSAHADDWGCQVLLCLSNPNGPMAVSECVPPISKLYQHLAKGHSMPTCALASGPNGDSYAKQGYSYYDPCPAGTSELPAGARVIKGSTVPQLNYLQQYNGQIYTGIGDGSGWQPSAEDSSMPHKVCVGKKVGDTMITDGVGDSQTTFAADVFDNVVTMDAQVSPRYIDVFIDNQLFRRVRW